MARISFLGDISLNNRYNKLHSEGSNPFFLVSKILSRSDLNIGNLECLSVGDSENYERKPRLSTKTETLSFLKNIPLSIACLANNHVADNLEKGFTNTINQLEEFKIEYLGASNHYGEEVKPVIKMVNGIKICILNYVSKDTDPMIPNDCQINLNLLDRGKVLNDLKNFKNDADYLILVLHWGGKVENYYYPDWEQPKLAHEFIDAGVDLIIGHHSHTIQPYEIYKGKHIFYSIGNFCFDDILHEGKLYSKLNGRKKKSIIVTAEFTLNSINIELNHIKNNNLIIELSDSMPLRIHIRNFTFRIIKRNKLLWIIFYKGHKLFYPLFDFILNQDGNLFVKLKKMNLIKLKKHMRKLKIV